MPDLDEIERRIRELESEVGFALYPVTREEFTKGMLSVSDEVARAQNIDMEWRRNNKEQMWLSYLESIKREKDDNSALWNKMRNRD